MPAQRIALCFEDEVAADRDTWAAWVSALAEPLRSATTMGERRPLVAVAAPFPARDPIATRRDDEVAGLALARSLVESAAMIATNSSRVVWMLLDGRAVGRVMPASGADVPLAAKLAEWQVLLDARPPDEPEWEREGWVSVWAGVVPAGEIERLLEERYSEDGDDSPISPFAYALRIGFYDHDFIEHDHVGEPDDLARVVGRLSFASSFLDRIPEPLRRRKVNGAVAMYDADFSQRPRNAARGRLKFIGAYPYDAKAPPAGSDDD